MRCDGASGARVAAMLCDAGDGADAVAEHDAGASRVERRERAARQAEKPSDNYDELLPALPLQAARTQPTTASAPDPNWMTGLIGDLRARRVNDLVTVRVVESVSAVGHPPTPASTRTATARRR